MPSAVPPFPFGKIEIVGLGGRLHGPSLHSWSWVATMPHFNFWFLIRGLGRLRFGQREYRVEPGICFLFPPGAQVRGESLSDEPFVNFSVHFFPVPRRARSAELIRRLSARKVHRMGLFLELAHHCSTVYKWGDALSLRQVELTALQMMLQLWRESHAPSIHEGDDRILRLLGEGGAGALSIPGLARQAGLSSSQFTRRARALTGLAPREYLIRERISHACALLAETSRPVGEVAELLGYADPSYFVRQFQKTMKLTPARFRRSAAA